MKPKKPSVSLSIRFCIGVLLGYCIASTLRQICIYRTSHPDGPVGFQDGLNNGTNAGSNSKGFWRYLPPNLFDRWRLPTGGAVPERKLILVGIMTADKYINTRAKAIYDTWGPKIPGRVLFFVGSDSTYTGNLPVVRLDGVPVEDYPPQKKAFKMLQYMYQNYINEYEWFFRADDDVYVKGEKIESLLRSINSTKPWYIGQSGEGQSHEQGKLGLIEHMPYCMGGPGVMISHVALSELGPEIPNCMESVRTKHEDTEVGRCMQKSVGIGCSSAYELGKLLYQNYREKNGSFTHELGKVEKMAFTLHPVKRAPYVYRMHNFVTGEKVHTLREKVDRLQAEIRKVEHYINKISAGEKLNFELESEVIENGGASAGTQADDLKYAWEFFSGGSYFSHKSVHIKLSTEGRVDESAILALSHKWPKRLRELFPNSFMKIEKNVPCYIQISPLEGVNVNSHFQGSFIPRSSRKVKEFFAPVKIKQAFLELEFLEGKDSFRPFVVDSQSVNAMRILIPLSGKNAVLQRFLTRHVPLISNLNVPVSMVILLFKDQDGHLPNNIATIQSFQRKFSDFDIRLIDHSTELFSRANALTYGANLFGNDSLLLFMDIDMVFTKGFLLRVYQNTIQGKQIYFPVYFSQFNPEFICYQEPSCTVNDFDINSSSGIWRSYGYGMVGVYKSDFIEVGGFDTTIVGWGKEDVDFHERVLARELNAFRSADPGLLHLYHDKICENSLSNEQWKMCTKSKADLWGSSRTLTRLLKDISRPDLNDEINYFVLDSSSVDIMQKY